jgi:hypothetical protein
VQIELSLNIKALIEAIMEQAGDKFVEDQSLHGSGVCVSS